MESGRGIRIATLNIRSGRWGGGSGATHPTERQHRYRGLAGDKTHRGRPHATDIRLQGIVDGGGETTPGGDLHILEGQRGVGG